ncbi:MAG: GntR family transcriptional regulator [Tannerella sp.]|jgi:DNA-binding transcriptional regulator YhcF (GntR family)|nr:GntR family transcriptional regulator [Tannerella sp.]
MKIIEPLYSYMNFSITPDSQTPIYKQLIQSVQQQIKEGSLKEGNFLPSMNELSATLSISKETVKKAYSILREKGIIESAQGKGFFVAIENSGKTRVLVLFDKLSTYKLVLYRSFMEHVDENTDVTIHLHNQDINLFENLLEENLNKYDYYLITPHFTLDADIQKRAIKLLKKIPNRKLILLDRHIESLKGNFGSVYQDFENDVYTGLIKAMKYLKKYDIIRVFSVPSSMYGSLIKKGISRFCDDYKLNYELLKEFDKNDIKKGDLYIVLNSQLDDELIEIIKDINSKRIKTGKDVGILSYNESPVNEIILNGLTAISTDFKEMGRLAAEMIKSGNLEKIRNKFQLIVRGTV